MNLCIVFIRASYLRNKNESNDKKKKKESEKEKNKQYLYVKKTTLFEILICLRYHKVTCHNQINNITMQISYH